MALLKSVNLPLAHGTIPKAELEKFIALVPDDTPVMVDVRFIPKDRPYESDKTEVALRAQWIDDE